MSNHYQFLVSYTLEQGDGHGGDEPRWAIGTASMRSSATAPPTAATASSPAASSSCRPTSSCRRSPTSDRACRSPRPARCDLNGDGYTGDLPAGVLPGTGCRDLNLDAVNTFRRSRGLTEVTTVDCPASPTSICGCRRSSASARTRAEFIAQLFNIFNRANFNAPNAQRQRGATTRSGRPLFGQSTSLLPNINAPSRQAEFAVRFQF